MEYTTLLHSVGSGLEKDALGAVGLGRVLSLLGVVVCGDSWHGMAYDEMGWLVRWYVDQSAGKIAMGQE
jgi:hypothetical protein